MARNALGLLGSLLDAAEEIHCNNQNGLLLMKYSFPENHGLSESIISHLVFKDEDKPALSDVQYESLSAGVGREESILVVSPTSTGKTQIALWAISKSLEMGCNTVYLVTHRALAKQKFDDFQTVLLKNFLYGESSALGIATGDYVRNANGDNLSRPLELPLLIATYEKYLALLSASGVPSDMKNTVVVCDEVQLIADKNRGQSVEVLLTLLRNAGWKQFVGLSAVLEKKDASDLANWLNIRAIIQNTREKHLRYECWTQKGITAVSTDNVDAIQENLPVPSNVSPNTISVLSSLLSKKPSPIPIIVFCMRKKDIYDLAESMLDKFSKLHKKQPSIAFDNLPQTAANTFLSRAMAYRIGIHSADLTDEERHIVENNLLKGNLDIVFSTSTLAAGVNFPLGAAIFASWSRWDNDRKCNIPIETSEFHNMAGRVGRMGYNHEQGRIIFFANQFHDILSARKYLNLGAMPILEPRILPQRFNQLALQLIASGLSTSQLDVERLVCTTFSALREQDKNNKSFSRWPTLLADAIEELVNNRLIIKTSAGNLTATEVGKAISYSGLLPETGVFLLRYIRHKYIKLVGYLPTPEKTGDMERLAYLIFCACYSTPEFRRQNGKPQTRFLPWPLDNNILFDADSLREELPEPAWQADKVPINAAKITIDWINGVELSELEKSLPDLSAGMLREMFRNLSWMLQGFASIIAATVSPKNSLSNDYKDIKIPELNKFPRFIRRLSYRVNEGLPDDVLWMTTLNSQGEPFHVSRHEIIALRNLGYSSPEQIMLGSPQAEKARIQVFSKIKPTPVVKANWLRDACRVWKQNQRKRLAGKHLNRVKGQTLFDPLKLYYESRGIDFEKAFEEVLCLLSIEFKRLDDKDKTGAPDYMLLLKNYSPIVMELKSKEGDNLVDYNKATEVLSASQIHGYQNEFCVTLCHPGVDPSVPNNIVGCGRLSVVESTDLAEALLRIYMKELTQEQLWEWLATPGQAVIDDLPFKESA